MTPATASSPPSQRGYFLIKSEPGVYSIADLEEHGTTGWEGVRNYQARNWMRKMRLGDLCLFYHSSAKPPGVAGLCEVSRLAYPDDTQFDPQSHYYDEKSSPGSPRWDRVDVRFVERFARLVPLDELKGDPALEGMLVVRRGMRLSVQPVEPHHFRHVLQLAGAKTAT